MTSKPTIRKVMFSPPSEPPTIYWMHGHVAIDDFVKLHGAINGVGAQLKSAPLQVQYGWGSRKLDHIFLYLSDTPLANFEPITYWIPADHLEVVSA